MPSSAVTLATDIAVLASAVLVAAGAIKASKPFRTSTGDEDADDMLCEPDSENDTVRSGPISTVTGKVDAGITANEVTSPIRSASPWLSSQAYD